MDLPVKIIYFRLGIVGSFCELTTEEDILVGISGIANIMERALKDQYIGGLWRSTL